MKGITFYLNSTGTVPFFTMLGLPDRIFCLAPKGEERTRNTETILLATLVTMEEALDVARQYKGAHAITTEHAVKTWVAQLRKRIKQSKQSSLALGG